MSFGEVSLSYLTRMVWSRRRIHESSTILTKLRFHDFFGVTAFSLLAIDLSPEYWTLSRMCTLAAAICRPTSSTENGSGDYSVSLWQRRSRVHHTHAEVDTLKP